MVLNMTPGQIQSANPCPTSPAVPTRRQQNIPTTKRTPEVTENTRPAKIRTLPTRTPPAPTRNPQKIATAKRTPEVTENKAPALATIPTIPTPPRSCYPVTVLVEERGSSVTQRAVPRGTERRVKGATSPKSVRRTRAASRLVGKANICPLSFDLEFGIGWSAIGKLNFRPSLTVPLI
jgi:hypothetical protein